MEGVETEVVGWAVDDGGASGKKGGRVEWEKESGVVVEGGNEEYKRVDIEESGGFIGGE